MLITGEKNLQRTYFFPLTSRAQATKKKTTNDDAQNSVDLPRFSFLRLDIVINGLTGEQFDVISLPTGKKSLGKSKMKFFKKRENLSESFQIPVRDLTKLLQE